MIDKESTGVTDVPASSARLIEIFCVVLIVCAQVCGWNGVDGGS